MGSIPDLLVKEPKEEDKPMEQPLRESTVMPSKKTPVLSWAGWLPSCCETPYKAIKEKLS